MKLTKGKILRRKKEDWMNRLWEWGMRMRMRGFEKNANLLYTGVDDRISRIIRYFPTSRNGCCQSRSLPYLTCTAISRKDVAVMHKRFSLRSSISDGKVFPYWEIQSRETIRMSNKCLADGRMRRCWFHTRIWYHHQCLDHFPWMYYSVKLTLWINFHGKEQSKAAIHRKV